MDSSSAIIWTKDFSVGVQELDKQHQQLFIFINQLDISLKDLTGKAEVLRAGQQLLDYSAFHFKTEEDYFEKFNYNHKASHIASHDLYKIKIEKFIKESKEKNEMIASEIISFIKAWWIGHVNNQDKLYTKCFHEHGLY